MKRLSINMKPSMRMILLISVVLVLSGCSEKQYSGPSDHADNPSQTPDTVPDITPAENNAEENKYHYPYAFTAKEIRCRNGEKQIYGIAYIPETNEKVPLVIFAHGLGGTHQAGIPYAESLAESGYGVYIFDFCAGTPDTGSRSDGSDLEMSVMTEKTDLECVLSAAKTWDFADSDRIFLMGISQGGTVAALTGIHHADDISGLILLNPAFNIFSMIHERFPDKESIPAEFDIFNGWFHVSSIYAEDIWDTDLYKELSEYQGSVLLLHGEKDSVVDISFSDKADQVLPDCEYHVIPGSDHEFYNESFRQVMELTLDYLDRAR